MPKLKPESLFPPSILPPEFQLSLTDEIKQKLELAKNQLPVESVYYPPADLAEKNMLKILIADRPNNSQAGPLLFLRRGRENYADAINHPFDFSAIGNQDTNKTFTEGPFPPALAAAMAYLHQECDGIQAMRFNAEAANDLGVNTTASFGDGLRGFLNQISVFARTTPFGVNSQNLISTVAERQAKMYAMNLAANKQAAALVSMNRQSSKYDAADRLRIINEQQDYLHAIMHGQRLLSSLLLFPWEEPDSGKLLVSPE